MHLIAKIQIELNEKPLIRKSGRLYIHVVVWRLFVSCRHVGNSSDLTLAFEDSQVIQPFSREKTDNTDDTDDTDDTEGTDDTEDTDDTDDRERKEITESTESTEST